MKIDRVLELLKIERECVTRQSPCNEKSKLCDRNCGECDIAQNDLELIEMYDFVISMIETLIGRSQWISVKDRLPPNADHPGAFCPRYLVCTDFGITVGWYNPDKGKWYGCGWWMYDTNRVADVDFERGDIPKRVVLPVEAWMPLPKAPEVKQNETD